MDASGLQAIAMNEKEKKAPLMQVGRNEVLRAGESFSFSFFFSVRLGDGGGHKVGNKINGTFKLLKCSPR